MEYLSVKTAAEKMGISEDKVRTLCREGKLAGAEKKGNVWIIPDTTIENYNTSLKNNKTTSDESSQEDDALVFDDKKLIKGLIIGLFLFFAFLAMAIAGIILLIDEASALGALLALFGAGGDYLMIKVLNNQLKTIKATINKQKAQNQKSSLKKKIIQTAAIAVSLITVLSAGALCVYGAIDATHLNKKADELLESPVSESTFDALVNFDEYYSKESNFTKLFFTRKGEIEALKTQANQLVLERAEEVSKGISALKPLKKITSVEQYNNICEKIDNLQLSTDDNFDKKVLEHVDNYDDFLTYVDKFNQLCNKYTVTLRCSSCSGKGRFSCSYCGGSGKCLVT